MGRKADESAKESGMRAAGYHLCSAAGYQECRMDRKADECAQRMKAGYHECSGTRWQRVTTNAAGESG